MRRPRVGISADIIKILTIYLLKQSLKTRKKIKELEIMHENAT